MSVLPRQSTTSVGTGGGHLVSLERRVYRELREMIIRGDLKPGDQLVQETLSDILGVSRTPLRTAIAELARDSFVELTPRGSAYVKEFTSDELANIWEIRAVLEGLVCRLLAPSIEPKHVAYLRSLMKSAASAVERSDHASYRRADLEFHTYLAGLAMDQLNRILDTFQILSLSLAQGLLRAPEETLPEHIAILDALEARDPTAAEQAMLAHIRNTLEHGIPGRPS